MDYLFNDIRYDIASLIDIKDLPSFSNCDVYLNNMINDPILLRKKLCSIHCKSKEFIDNKNWKMVHRMAASFGYLDICKHIEQVTKLTDNYIRHSLKYAAFDGHMDVCKHLMSLCTDLGPIDFNYILGSASFSGNIELCKYIVSLGVTDLTDAFAFAARGGHLDLCKYYVSIGAYTFVSALQCSYDDRNNNGVYSYLLEQKNIYELN